MGHIKNERGSALVFVLLLTVIFTILLVSLSTAIINNAKQISKTEGDLQTTSLAEMGVNYQKARVLTKLINVVNDPDVQNEINTQFQQYINELNLTEELYETKKEEINHQLKEIVLQVWTEALQFLQELDQNLIKNIDVTSSFEIRDHLTITNDQGILVSFTSIGNTHDNSTSLKTMLDVPITSSSIFSIEFVEGDDGNEPNVPGIGTGIFNPDYFIGEPELLPLCPTNMAITTDCRYEGDYTVFSGSVLDERKLHITGSLTLPINMNNSNTNSTIWVSEDFTITDSNNINSTDNLIIRVGGDADFGSGNINNFSNSILVVLGNATFGGHFNNMGRDGRSIIFIGGREGEIISFGGHVDIEDGILYGGEDTKITNNLSVASNSKVCINGDLEVGGNIQTNYENIFAMSTNHPSRVITDPDALKQNCAIEEIQDDVHRLIPIISMDADFNIEDLFDMSTEYNYIYN